ncbi:uncharacterized protein PSFLO_03845 [Pseudozyma flocculosa]|uniref:Uncharacterized protein n=1 Tax=Pseudozyma flocculosa TaxID=84751 RepID=A0A5C3F1P7_9BASI|nr:uncharacterized protein PSFLO_03845 [Pseudozyma flocculosa]
MRFDLRLPIFILLLTLGATHGVYALGSAYTIPGVGRVEFRVGPGRGQLCLHGVATWWLSRPDSDEELNIACRGAPGSVECRPHPQRFCFALNDCAFRRKAFIEPCYTAFSRDPSVFEGIERMLANPLRDIGVRVLKHGEQQQVNFYFLGGFKPTD